MCAVCFVLPCWRVVFALNTVPASAAPGLSRSSSTTVTVTSTAHGLGVQSTIVCTINVQNPHKSRTCRAPSMSFHAWIAPLRVQHRGRRLALPGRRTGLQQGRRNYGVAALQVNTTAPGVNGSYVGEGPATVYFPPNYYPPAGTIGMTTSPVAITC
jgi:hypothetical protein